MRIQNSNSSFSAKNKCVELLVNQVIPFFVPCILYYSIMTHVESKDRDIANQIGTPQEACDIIAGIRPQNVTVGKGELTAVIEVSEMLGSEFNLHTRSGNDEVVMVIPTIGLKEDVSMGSEVHFTVDPGLIQLFDKSSGNNLIWYDENSSKAHAPVCRNYEF